MSHEEIVGVLIVGDGRFQVAVIETKKPMSPDILIESLWPLIEQANQQSQGAGRLTKSKIAIVQPGDFARAPKGTIVRSATTKKLHSVIEQLYSESDDSGSSVNTEKQQLSDTCDYQSLIDQLVKDYIHGLDKLAAAKDGDDLFNFELDSLITLELSKHIRTGLSNYFDQSQLSFVTTPMVFRYPTIKDLSQAISAGLLSDLKEKYSQTYENEIERMIETYTSTTNPQQATIVPAEDGLFENCFN